jgi:hypothetical protein
MYKNCSICRSSFIATTNKKYCSDICRADGRKKSINKYNRSEKRKIISSKYKKTSKGKIAQIKHRPSKKYLKEYYLVNDEKIKDRSTKRYKKYREDILKKQSEKYASISQEKRTEKNKKNQLWKKTPLGKSYNRYDSSKRRKQVRQATPKWNDEDKTKYIYNIGLKLQNLYNLNFHIDHIVPLKGITFEDEAEVCGLNVYYNLMPVTENVNESKKNFCPPTKQIKDTKIKHLSLDQLPAPKNWIKFIDQIYLNALKYNKKSKERARMLKNYIETNPRLMRK